MIDVRPRTPREVAAFSLFSMAEEGAWSDAALHYYLNRAKLDSRDAALATRMMYGTVQNELLCDYYLRRFSSVRLKKIAPRVLACLRLGVYQLVLMDKIPSHAAVSETVELVRRRCHANDRTVSFANGVLRSAAAAVQQGTLPVLDCPDKESYYSLKYSHPEWLVRLLSAQYGQKETERICQANNADAPTSVRVNLLKTTPADAEAELVQAGLTVEVHPSFAEILLVSGGDVAALPAFIEGRVTVQDAASALAAAVVDPAENSFVLDCCAAPGGKSFAMAERMRNTGTVISCDIYEHKLQKIADGAQRLGLTNVRPTLADASKPNAEWQGKADYVLCDVPCSGLGIIRKKPEIRFKDEHEIEGLPAIQSAILQNSAQYVKAGGTLVYSTCTTLARENEDVVRAFLAEHDDFEAVSWSHPVCGTRENGMVTLLPHLHGTDGFFIAKMRKKA